MVEPLHFIVSTCRCKCCGWDVCHRSWWNRRCTSISKHELFLIFMRRWRVNLLIFIFIAVIFVCGVRNICSIFWGGPRIHLTHIPTNFSRTIQVEVWHLKPVKLQLSRCSFYWLPDISRSKERGWRRVLGLFGRMRDRRRRGRGRTCWFVGGNVCRLWRVT